MADRAEAARGAAATTRRTATADMTLGETRGETRRRRAKRAARVRRGVRLARNAPIGKASSRDTLDTCHSERPVGARVADDASDHLEGIPSPRSHSPSIHGASLRVLRITRCVRYRAVTHPSPSPPPPPLLSPRSSPLSPPCPSPAHPPAPQPLGCSCRTAHPPPARTPSRPPPA